MADKNKTIDYVNYAGLTHFLNNLIQKFATFDYVNEAVESVADVIANDDGEGNVTLVCMNQNKYNSLENDIATLKSTLNDLNNNEFLVVNK